MQIEAMQSLNKNTQKSNKTMKQTARSNIRAPLDTFFN